MEEEKFSVIKRIKSFKPAFNGIWILLKEEHNSRIHLIAAICALTASALFKISAGKWIAVILATGFVFTAEIFNTALEHLSDFVSPGMNIPVKKIKDLSAAAVLVSVVTALVTGIIVFLPEIIRLFRPA